MWWDAFGILRCIKQGDRQIEHREFNSSWNHRAFDTIVSGTLFSKYAAGFLNTSRLYDGINYSFETKTKPLAMGISTRKGRYLRQWIQKIYDLAIELRRYEGLFKNDNLSLFLITSVADWESCNIIIPQGVILENY